MLGPIYHPKGLKNQFVVGQNIVATIRVEPSVLMFFYDYLENGKQLMLQPIHFWKDLFGNVWVVALIAFRFRDNRQKHQHRRLNSYRLTIGATTHTFSERYFRDLFG